MNRKRGVRGASGLSHLVLVVLLVMAALGALAAEISNVPPDLVMERLDGTVETLGQYRGKVVVLNVWATWCVPCRVEMPELQKLADRLDPKKYVVLGLSIDDNSALLGEYLRERKITFARHVDRGGRQVKERLKLSSLPFTIILSPGGDVLWSEIGRREWGDPAVAVWVRGLK